jgi:wyosine [tRNA(Phe)-imidazoG37] synthetase (radical SAM superfamily)
MDQVPETAQPEVPRSRHRVGQLACEAVDGLYLKANGEVPCWCSPREDQPLLRLEASHVHALAAGGAVDDLIDAPPLRRMRRELFEGREPFPECRACAFLRPGRTPAGEQAWSHVERGTFRLRRIATLQVESSWLCNVDCPLCIPLAVRRSVKAPPYALPVELFDAVVTGLAARRIAVERVWFSGRGEPFLHPRIATLAALAKRRLGAQVGIHTNANVGFRAELGEAGFDEVVFSIDGATQEAYERYRRGASLARAVRFAAEFARARRASGRRTPTLTWKMVLFEWNSDEAAIRTVVARAKEIGLDQVLLVDTDTPGGISYRGDRARVAEIRALAECLQREAGLAVYVEGYRSVYGARPEVDLGVRIDREQGAEGPRYVALGRLFNEQFEPRLVAVRAEVRGAGGDHLDVYASRLLLRERAELVDSILVPVGHLPEGRLVFEARVDDAASGRMLDTQAIEFEHWR